MRDDLHENVIEWISGDTEIACTFTQRKYINKVKKLRELSADNVPVLIENDDGSVFCHLPISCLKIGKKRNVTFSEEERLLRAERMRSAREMSQH